MSFKKLFLFLVLSILPMGLSAQNSASFPFSGKYKVLNQSAEQASQFNQLTVEQRSFMLQLNGKVVKYFKIERLSEAGYHVARYFPELEKQPFEIERFIIRFDNSSETNPSVTLIFPTGTESMTLSRIAE